MNFFGRIAHFLFCSNAHSLHIGCWRRQWVCIASALLRQQGAIHQSARNIHHPPALKTRTTTQIHMANPEHPKQNSKSNACGEMLKFTSLKFISFTLLDRFVLVRAQLCRKKHEQAEESHIFLTNDFASVQVPSKSP